jgi:putative hemin transport protein
MDVRVKPSPHEIRRARADNPKMRERDFARIMGISEAEYISSYCGENVRRIQPRVNDVLAGLAAVGEVMALTRNEGAVHEKIGVYDRFVPGQQAAMMLGPDIDLRVFPASWVHGFSVEKREDGEVRRSLQFFDAAGDAVHKVHLRPASDVAAFTALVDSLGTDDQSPGCEVEPETARAGGEIASTASAETLRERWLAMEDTHQFHGLLRSLKLDRLHALRMAGPDLAWRLDAGSVTAMMHQAAERALPIMCFVGSKGCIQIHSGPIAKLAPMGPWINVLDETFHLHLRTDLIAEAWGVRKPVSGGHVTSVEAYDADGRLIIQFFGKRHEGEDELAGWRTLAEAMPHLPAAAGVPA